MKCALLEAGNCFDPAFHGGGRKRKREREMLRGNYALKGPPDKMGTLSNRITILIYKRLSLPIIITCV